MKYDICRVTKVCGFGENRFHSYLTRQYFFRQESVGFSDLAQDTYGLRELTD